MHDPMPDPSELRQQHNYEVLVEPAYRVDLQLANDDLRGRLQDRLCDGTSYYPPSLGLSEHLAEVTYLGEFEVTPHERETTNVDSAVYSKPSIASNLPLKRRSKSNGHRRLWRADEGGRTTTAFQSIGTQLERSHPST